VWNHDSETHRVLHKCIRHTPIVSTDFDKANAINAEPKVDLMLELFIRKYHGKAGSGVNRNVTKRRKDMTYFATNAQASGGWTP
jgi:hypothetical protein